MHLLIVVAPPFRNQHQMFHAWRRRRQSYLLPNVRGGDCGDGESTSHSVVAAAVVTAADLLLAAGVVCGVLGVPATVVKRNLEQIPFLDRHYSLDYLAVLTSGGVPPSFTLTFLNISAGRVAQDGSTAAITAVNSAVCCLSL